MAINSLGGAQTVLPELSKRSGHLMEYSNQHINIESAAFYELRDAKHLLKSEPTVRTVAVQLLIHDNNLDIGTQK